MVPANRFESGAAPAPDDAISPEDAIPGARRPRCSLPSTKGSPFGYPGNRE